MDAALGTSELIIILIIVVVVFGSTKLPQLGEGLGKAIRNFKKSVDGGKQLDVTPKKGGELREGGEGAPQTAEKQTASKS